MRSRTYKIKNNKTAQFWTGYQSNFTDRGKEWPTWDAAALEIKTQIKLKHRSINNWWNDAEIVEYEVDVTEIGSRPLIHGVMRSNFYEHLAKKYGKELVKHYHKICEDGETKGKFKYGIQVPKAEYEAFREAMKGLGFSSRHFKKTDSWLWIEDDEVMLRAKLLNHVIQTFYVTSEEEIYQASVDECVALYGE